MFKLGFLGRPLFNKTAILFAFLTRWAKNSAEKMLYNRQQRFTC